MDRPLELELLLHDRFGQPAHPTRRQAHASSRSRRMPKTTKYGTSTPSTTTSPTGRRDQADDHSETHHRDPQRHDTFNHNHPPIRRDLAGENGAEAEQRRRLEYV
ncbi:MAG: hypothetical protein WBP81_20000 [Solirubrobacteraceae bacterium]